MFGQIIRHFKEIWLRLSKFICVNLLVFWAMFGLLISVKISASDGWSWGLLGALMLLCLIVPLMFEAAALLEYRGVEISSFDNASTKMRDSWIGKVFLRILLIFGNVVFIFLLLKLI